MTSIARLGATARCLRTGAVAARPVGVAGFHATSRRELIPAGPRKNPLPSSRRWFFTIGILTAILQRLSRAEVHESPPSLSLPNSPVRSVNKVENAHNLFTVNDPTSIPTPSATHGSYHWTFERLIAAGLVPLSVAPFAAGSLNPTLDALLCGTLLLHSHMGFQAVILDYVPKYRFPGAHKAVMWLLRLATLTVGVGLYEFETNDVGVTEAVKRVWKA